MPTLIAPFRSSSQLELHPLCPIPGRLVLLRGKTADYRALAQYHYRRNRPATFAAIWTIRYYPDGHWGEPSGASWPVVVAILSYPTLASRQRDRALNLAQLAPSAKARFINRNLRTISRVTVHPTFRSLGLGRLLIRHILDHATTRYTEALAAMGHAHPLFSSAGMTAMPRLHGDKRIYYLFDRHAQGVLATKCVTLLQKHNCITATAHPALRAFGPAARYK